MVTLYRSYFEKRYTSKLFTCSTFFVGILFLLTIIIPYILVFITNNMWMKQNYYFEQPDVSFRNEIILEVLDSSGSSYLFSTVKAINDLSLNELGAPLV